MAIKLYEMFRAVFYTPFYLAHALGAYAAEGLDVALDRTPDLDGVDGQLQRGEADVCWGGPMRIMKMHDRNPGCGLVGFCEVVTRDPFCLVGREPRPAFDLRDLKGLRLATVSEVPTPWMCLQDDLRRAGVDPGALDRESGRTMAQNAAALRAGEVDVVQLFQPFVEDLLAEKAGHLWQAAADRGPCSYTTLYTLGSTLAAKPELAMAMTRAVYRTQKWLHRHDAGAVAAAVAEFFPDCPRERLAAAIARYLDLGIWGRDPVLPEQGFTRLRAALLSGGLIGREIAFADCVDNRFAQAVIAENPPSL